MGLSPSSSTIFCVIKQCEAPVSQSAFFKVGIGLGAKDSSSNGKEIPISEIIELKRPAADSILKA
jgi:hypothetical protein